MTALLSEIIVFIEILKELPIELIHGMFIPVGCFYYSWWSINKLYQKDYSLMKKIGLISFFPIFSAMIIGLDYYLNWEELFLFSWFLSLIVSLAILTRKQARGKSIKEILQIK